jgi:hypothetical protein
MDEVVQTALEALLAAGWRGVLAALLVAGLYALARVYGVEVGRLLAVVFRPRGPQSPADEGGAQSPGSVPVDANGTPIGNGRPPPHESGDGG